MAVNLKALGTTFRARPYKKTAAFGLLAALTAAANAQTYSLLRCDLHAHTGYSDGGAAGSTTVDPGTASAAARGNLLTGFATTDHGEQISAANWTNTKTLLTQATVLGKLTAIWGFEWTRTNDAGNPLTNTGLGHIIVYGSDTRTGSDPFPSGSTNLAQSDASEYLWKHWVNGSLTSTNSLYQWILDHATSTALGGTIVGQFNHPSIYPTASLANPSEDYGIGTGTEPDWWRKLEWVKALDPYMVLMEIGGRSVAIQPAAWNEPYFDLALDNGWHVAPTDNEDNHGDAYGNARTYKSADDHTFVTETGVWAEAGTTPLDAQSKFLGALRARRVFASEERTPTTNAPYHPNQISLKWVFNTPTGVKWMGTQDMSPSDIANNQCELDLTRTGGLVLDKVEVVSNNGAVRLTLPVTGSNVTANSATWNFSLPGDTPGPQLRAFSATQPASPVASQPPLPPDSGAAPLAVGFDASSTGRIERYYYVRVTHETAANAAGPAGPRYVYSAPIWLHRGATTVTANNGAGPEIAANITSFTWDFDDGSVTQTSSDGRAQHTYTTNGLYFPRVTIAYNDGTSETAISQVNVGGTSLPVLYGDVNGDGQITGDDVALEMKIAAGMAAPDAGMVTRGDVSGIGNPVRPPDGHITMADVMKLSRFVNGLGPNWPND